MTLFHKPHGARLEFAAACCFLALLLAIVSCDERRSPSDAGPADAGRRDAGTLCARNVFFDGPPVDLAACGVCVEAHVRSASPYQLNTSQRLEAVVVPAGLLITMDMGDTIVTVVTNDGQVIPLPEFPYTTPSGPDLDRFWPLRGFSSPVPGGDGVWVVTNFTDTFACPGESHAEVVLYQVTSAGWRRQAAGTVEEIFAATAVSTGELLGELGDACGGPMEHAVRLRGDGAGGLDVLRHVDFGVDYGQPYEAWPLEGGLAAFLLRQYRPPNVSPSGYRSVIVRVNAELATVGPPVWLSPELDSRLFEPDGIPLVMETATHTAGRRSMLLDGTPRDLPEPAAPGAVMWVQRVTPEGDLEWPVPGRLVNMDLYLRAADVEYPLGAGFGGMIRPLPGGSDFVACNERVFGDADGVVRAEIVDGAGSVVHPVPSVFDLETPLLNGVWALDDLENAYLAFGTRTDGVYRVGVQRLNADLTFAWPEAWHLGQCDTQDRRNLHIVGAAGGGVWVVWEEVLTDNVGSRVGVTKVTLLRPDGSYAWDD